MDTSSISSTRRYDIDWLRVLLILIVFVFHSMRFFNLEDWTVKNANTYLSIEILVIFISRWMMPAIMLISGMATFYALGKRGASRFIKDRSLRLLVPLLVGLFTHIALQSYIWDVGKNQYSGSFWQWYPSIFSGNFAWRGAHLWYLEALFLLSLVCLPLFTWLRHGSGQRALAWLDSRLSSPWAVYLPVLIILPLSAALDPDSGSLLTEEFGGWNLPSYLVFFLCGFVLASSPAMQASIRRIRWISLTAGVLAFAGAGVLFALTGGDAAFGTPFYLVWTVISSLTCWGCMLAILGFGMQRLNVLSPVLNYASEAVLPFYVMHQTVLYVVGFYVVNWAVPDLAKWAIILISSFMIIMGLYELMVRRINLMRVLFGMKPMHKEQMVQKPAAQVA